MRGEGGIFGELGIFFDSRSVGGEVKGTHVCKCLFGLERNYWIKGHMSYHIFTCSEIHTSKKKKKKAGEIMREKMQSYEQMVSSTYFAPFPNPYGLPWF